MWSALENIALRESLPPPLVPGELVNGILVAGQYPIEGHNLFHLGNRRFRPYLLKQFYSLDTNAFLRRQNESRFITLPQPRHVNWPAEEWRGGVIIPRVSGITLHRWTTQQQPSTSDRLQVAANLALHLAALHENGIAHRDISLHTVLVDGKDIVLTDFGSAVTAFWDDLWTDTVFSPRRNAWACPPLPGETEPPKAIDIHAYGAILQVLATQTPPYTRRHCLAHHFLPFKIRPIKPPRQDDLPPIVYDLIDACLAGRAEDRPSMQEVARGMAAFGAERRIEAITPMDAGADPHEKDRVMVFISDDHYSVSLFDAVLEIAAARPSMFLIVSIIPNNLPCGHTQRFKGSLFRKLNHGLMRCRAAKVSWSLRILENVDREQAASTLVQQYAPQSILVGAGSARSRWRTSFPNSLKYGDLPVTIID